MGVHEKGVSRESGMEQAARDRALDQHQDLQLRFKSMNGSRENEAPKRYIFDENYRSVGSDSGAQGDFEWSA